jgi:acyl-coenzyme A thioesterase PaaI-like protein
MLLTVSLWLLSVGLADEIMGCTEIEMNDDRVVVERECAHEDMSTLGNILHGGVVHSASLGSNSSLRMAGMTLRLRRVNLP